MLLSTVELHRVSSKIIRRNFKNIAPNKKCPIFFGSDSIYMCMRFMVYGVVRSRVFRVRVKRKLGLKV